MAGGGSETAPYGTGSYSTDFCLWKGWHRDSLRRASQPPLRAPYFSTASRAYSEQVGIKRQQGGRRGEMARR